MVMDKSCFDKMPLISIIVPVFNVEAYIERCIKSLISQSYENIEIIIVDDGSTDQSGKICDKFQNKDSRVRVIHKSNGGPSDARNVGIAKTNGKYISFVDADDWVAKDYIMEMYHLMVNTNSEVVACSFDRVSGNKVTKSKESDKYQIFCEQDIIKQFLYQKISTSAWGKLYKANLWDGVRFPVQKMYEEVEPLYYIFTKCKQIICMEKRLYFYYIRGGSIVNQKFSIKKMDYVNNCEKLLIHIESDYPQFKSAAISRLMWAEIHVLMHMDTPREYPDEYRMLMHDIKQYRRIVIKDRENKWKTRLVAGLSYFGYGILKAIFNLMRKFSNL